MEEIRELYRRRFDPAEKERKERLWKILCRYLQRYVPPESAVLDLGAGYCEFINHIGAARKIAVDLNPDTAGHAAPGVEVVKAPCGNLGFLRDGEIGVVFICNLLEHLASKDEVLRVLKEVARVLRPGGRLILIQPNIRYAFNEYWDFLDHHVALSDRSLAEAVTLAGLEPRTVLARFLPYSTKGALRSWVFLFEIYIRFPLAWRLFGKQALIVAEKPPAVPQP